MSAVQSTGPDPRAYSDDLKRALAILARAKVGGDSGQWLQASAVSAILRDEFGIRVHWRTIKTQLSADKTLAERRKRQGRWEFAIMDSGIALLDPGPAPVTIVDPAQALLATKSLHEFLGSLKSPVRVCDPYLDDVTLEHLDACPPGCTVRLLTKNVRDTGTLRRLLAAARQRRTLEIHIATTGALHDRYIIDQASMVILGTSLNGFGKKQCFIVRAGADIRASMEQAFDALWNAGTPWP